MSQKGCDLDKEDAAAEILKPLVPPQSPPSSSSPSPSIYNNSNNTNSKPEFSLKRKDPPAAEDDATAPKEGASRCAACRRRVGLAAGFRCRCGELFCGRHRYTDAHKCSFDYKKLGREEIAKANPVVRAAKIIKI